MKKFGFKESRISPEHYFEWRKERGSKPVNELDSMISLKGKKVLDIGCGYGALSSLILSKGAKVWGTEVNEFKLKVANKKLGKNKNFTSILVKDEKLPFKDEYFDCVFIFDVIEHVNHPKKTINECARVLKPGGYLYVEFTPYYSISGHHLYDFAKWPIHILPPEKIKKIVYSKKVDSFMTADYYWDQFLSLNKLRIGNFQKMVLGFKTIDEKFIIKYPEIFELNLTFINYFGFFKDYFTMSFEGLYRK